MWRWIGSPRTSWRRNERARRVFIKMRHRPSGAHHEIETRDERCAPHTVAQPRSRLRRSGGLAIFQGGQEPQKLLTSQRAEFFRNMALVLGGEVLHFAEKNSSLRREMHGMAAAIGSRWCALQQISPFEAVEDMHEAGAFDAEGPSECHLRKPGICIDDRQHRVLGGSNFKRGERLVEVLEYPHLSSSQQVTKVSIQAVQIDARRGIVPI